MTHAGAILRVQALALMLAAGACGEGPTLELGDNHGAPDVASGGARGGAGEEGGGSAPLAGTDAATPRDAEVEPEEGAAPRMECTIAAECEPDRPLCHDGECVECVTADDCESDPGHPFCVSGECEECAEGEACEEEEQDCTEGESCETCAENSECTDPEKPLCDRERCVECTRDEHCASSGGCDVANGECR